ncbi:MAG: type restriction-modification system restriction subunit, partial [Chloroflexi bacterium]|nr:type restriction-modification system restriction subunit [Chloroflexota bacterium]
MNSVGQTERATQNRVVTLFCDGLGYRYLGDWADRAGDSNVEERILGDFLIKSGYTQAQASSAI